MLDAPSYPFTSIMSDLPVSAAELRAAIDEAATVVVCDREGRITWVNSHFCRVSGYSASELVGRTHRIVNSGYHPPGFFAEMWKTLGSGTVWRGEIKNRAKDGRAFWVYTTIVPIRGEAGRPDGYVAIRHDITAQKAVEDELRRSRATLEQREAELARAQELAQLGSWTWDLRSAVFTCSRQALRNLGLPLDVPALAFGDFVRLVHDEDRAGINETVAQILADDGPRSVEFRVRRPDGRDCVLLAEGTVVRDDRGELDHIFGTTLDVTERRETEARLAYMALHDDATGLPNRRLFDDRLRHALATAGRRGGGLAVLVVDLDHLKDVNDSFGHAAGDALLAEVARRMTAVVRAGDTVGRMGGDEFAILVEDLQDVAAAETIAAKLLAALARPFVFNSRPIPCSASIGIAVSPDHGQESEALLQYADAAMYRAKNDGRGGFRLYDHSIGSAQRRRLVLLDGLRQALARDEFHVVLQPQVELTSGRVHGAEVLLRWTHPELGPVSPVEFVPILEDSGLIGVVGEWVLRQACATLAALADAGTQRLRLAVNVSCRQLLDPQFAGTLARILAESGADGACLELELTESVFAADAAVVRDTLERCRALGVSVSVDDFGTGYSSLGYLRQFPIDVLKIDRRFTSAVLDQPHDAAIVEAVTTMATRIGLKVVAEGIETMAVAQFLRELGCELGQGFLYGRPMRMDDFLGLLRRSA